MQRETLSTPVLIGTFVMLSLVMAVMPVNWPHGDFIEYWAAARLNAAGGNPYDPAAILRQQQQAGFAEAEPVVMYNPPWTLALAMPFGAMSFALARSVWLALQLVTVLWCASRLWLLYGGEPRHTIHACCIALLWGPTLSAVHMGQVSTVILAGLVGFLQSLWRRRDTAAGAWVAVTLLKPQLLALLWVTLLLWALAGRRWKVLGGIAASVMGASIIAFAPNHSVFVQYQYLMTSAPPAFESPTISSILRVFANTPGSWPQYAPTFAGVLAAVVAWHRRRDGWDFRRELPWLVAASLFVTAYGAWSFDLVLLLIPMLAVGAAFVRYGDTAALVTGGLVFACVSAITVAMGLKGVPEELYVWVTPMVALACRHLWRAAASRRAVGYTRFS